MQLGMKSSKSISICIFLILPLIGLSQSDMDTAKTLNGLINSEGIFYNNYNKRDQALHKRLKEIVLKEKIDTIAIIINSYMDIKDSTSNPYWDDREYLIYKKLGKTYVDYFTYVRPYDYRKYRSSKKNPFNEGDNIFKYFINYNIDKIKGDYELRGDSDIVVSDNYTGYSGYVNIGRKLYEIKGIQGYRMSYIKIDKRIIFYKFIMKCLRNEGY